MQERTFKDSRNSSSDERERVKGNRQGSINSEDSNHNEIASSDIAYGM